MKTHLPIMVTLSCFFSSHAQVLHLPNIGMPPTTGVALPFVMPQAPGPVLYAPTKNSGTAKNNKRSRAVTNRSVNTQETITTSTYQIQSGDTLSGIAVRSGISLSTLLANNPSLSDKSVILPGQILNIDTPKITTNNSDMGGGKKIAATLPNNWQIDNSSDLSPTLCGHINCTRSGDGLVSEDGTHIWGDSMQINFEKQVTSPEQIATWPELSRLTLHPDSLELNAVALAFAYCTRSKSLTSRISCTRQGSVLRLSLKP